MLWRSSASVRWNFYHSFTILEKSKEKGSIMDEWKLSNKVAVLMDGTRNRLRKRKKESGR
jgi:hypothetical protein